MPTIHLPPPMEGFASPEPISLRALLDLIREVGWPDDRFADDLAEIQAAQQLIGESLWGS